MQNVFVLFIGLAAIVVIGAFASLLAGSMWGLENQVRKLKLMSAIKKDEKTFETLDPEEAIRLAVNVRRNAATMFLTLLGVIAIMMTIMVVAPAPRAETTGGTERSPKKEASGGTGSAVPLPERNEAPPATPPAVKEPARGGSGTKQ